MAQLIIAEKPSLERNIMAAIGSRKFQKQNGYYESDEYIITHTFGHLFGLVDIEEYLPKDVREKKRGWTLDGLPFCPKAFQYDFRKDPKTRKPDTSAKKQFSVIKSLVNRSDVDTIIHAGDADREGELIINHILDACHNKKPVMRLWLPEQTEETIAYELKHLKNDKEFASIQAEGEARTRIDWLYGVNLTRLATLKSGSFLRVGRVITPIVKAIYDRDMEIEHFVPEPYLVLKSKEKTNGIAIELTGKTKFFEDNRLLDANKMAQDYNQVPAVVKDVKQEKKTIGPGKLYSLSKLQGVLGKQFKMSMKESLAIIQKLYEAGYVTYPRTNTEYLAVQESGKINKIIALLQKQGYDVCPKDGNKQIYDDSKIESHSALTPTYKIPDVSKLSDGEQKVYTTILNRFLAVFCKIPCEVYRTTITIAVGDYEEFQLKGDIYITKGWKAYESVKTEDKELPALNKGDQISIHFAPEEKETKPPKHYTLETLNQYLENPFRKETKSTGDEEDGPHEAVTEDADYKAIFDGLELGTSATRTSIIEHAITSQYILLKNNTYYIQPQGKFLIESLMALGIHMDKYKTAELGKALKQVYRKELSVEGSIQLAMREVEDIFAKAQGISITQATKENEKEVLGKCPKCGSDIIETKAAYSCLNRDCKFALWKNDKYFAALGKNMTKTIAKSLLNKGSVSLKGLKSKKTGKEYEAFVKVDFSGLYPSYTMEFPQKGK